LIDAFLVAGAVADAAHAFIPYITTRMRKRFSPPREWANNAFSGAFLTYVKARFDSPGY
jgi:hypothetical protein